MYFSMLFLFLIVSTNSYKVLVYNPRFAYAHAKFMGTLADSLVESGLDVTVLVNDYDNHVRHNGSSLAKIIYVPPCEETNKLMRAATDDDFCQMIWKTSARNPLVIVAMNTVLEEVQVPQCKYLLSHTELLNRLKEEHFDVAITETWDSCGLGLFHLLGIKSTIIGSSMALLESTSTASGIPLFPSFVPGSMAPLNDKMSFFGRLENSLVVFLSLRLFHHLEDATTAVYKQKFQDFPTISELQAGAQLVFTNSVPFFDFPRFTLKKVLDLGGITHKEPKALNKEWNSILSKGPTVLLSFGSVSKSIHMPEEYKKTLIEVIKSFPNTTFIWKHEEPIDQRLSSVENIVASTWMPQTDLLGHPNLTAFITHGGANSVLEGTLNGKPMLVVPVFADQTRLGHMVQERGIGMLMAKEFLSDFNVLKGYIQKLIYDEELKSACHRFLLLQKAVAYEPHKLLGDHVKLLAEFKSLPELQPQSANLNFFYLYSLDIILFVVVSVVFLAVFSYYIAKSTVFFILKTISKRKIE